jgi:hypothetical protein
MPGATVWVSPGTARGISESGRLGELTYWIVKRGTSPSDRCQNLRIEFGTPGRHWAFSASVYGELQERRIRELLLSDPPRLPQHANEEPERLGFLAPSDVAGLRLGMDWHDLVSGFGRPVEVRSHPSGGFVARFLMRQEGGGTSETGLQTIRLVFGRDQRLAEEPGESELW